MVEKADPALPNHMALPTQLTPLLGREHELAQVCLCHGAARCAY